MPASDSAIDFETSSLQLGQGTPPGARTVLGRVVKDGATVPLFLGQTLVHSLRDLGYNNTTAAVCEHVDNAKYLGKINFVLDCCVLAGSRRTLISS